MGVNAVIDSDREDISLEEAETLGEDFDAAIDSLGGDENYSATVFDETINEKWDALAASDEEAAELARPYEAATTLRENWGEWDLGDVNFADPESSENWDELPDEAKAVLKYVASSDNLLQALDAPEAGEATDGKITKHSLEKFAEAQIDDLATASQAYETYLENNPNASDSAKALAKSAALLAANQTLIAASGGAMTYGAENQRDNNHGLHNSNLKAVENDAVFSQSLRDAAATWRQSGMNDMLDTASEAAALADADGVIGQEDITSWLENTTVSSDADTLSMLEAAAIRSSVASIDTSDLTADVLEHPEDYDGATKAAVLIQLEDAQTMMVSGQDNGLWDDIKLDADHINPNYDKVSAQLSDAIATLAADGDVQEYLADQRGSQLQSIVGTNAALSDALQSYADGGLVDGTALEEAMALTDANGDPVSTADALKSYVNQAATVDLALGGDGSPDLSGAAAAAGLEDELTDYFDTELKSGKALSDAIASGTDPMEAAETFMADAAVAKQVLGDSISDDDYAELSANYSDIMSDAILDTSDTTDLEAVYGDGNGDLDDDKIKAAFEAAVEADPSLAIAADGTTFTSDQVVKTVRSAWEAARKGEKFTDALDKLDYGSGATDAYKSGMMHIVASALTGSYLAVKAATGSGSTADDITLAGGTMAMAGTLLEGGTKYAKYTEASFATQSKTATSIIESSGKLIGNLGGGMTSALSIVTGVQALKDGDTTTGIFSLTSGALGGAAAVAGLVEGAIGLATATGAVAATEALTTAAAGFGAAAGALGAASAGVGVVGGLILFGIADYQENKAENDFVDTLSDTLRQYGLTGGTRERGDSEVMDDIDDSYDEPLIGS